MSSPILASRLALAIALSVCGAAHAAQPSRPAVRTGLQVYQQVCAKCHETNVGPRITGRALPLAVVKHFVRNGNNAMPALRETEVSDKELADLGKWLEASKAPEAQSAPKGQK